VTQGPRQPQEPQPQELPPVPQELQFDEVQPEHPWDDPVVVMRPPTEKAAVEASRSTSPDPQDGQVAVTVPIGTSSSKSLWHAWHRNSYRGMEPLLLTLVLG